MGPTCGMVLGDGAEVIKVEPIAGENTRKLLGSGAGFFAMFDRNKKSVALDLQKPEGKEAALRLIAAAGVVSDNFKPGTMQKLGLDYVSLSKLNDRFVYVSHKGFSPGPYDHRTALDEVVQMMGRRAYMTGRPGDPLRAGASVNDIMGGMFGAIGTMAALMQRAHIGKGQEVRSALFENNVFLVAQHMMQFAITVTPAAPIPGRISAWAVYDVFTVKDNKQIFLAVVSDTQWDIFCDAFGFSDLKTDARAASNNVRVEAREWMMPLARPQDLFDDPHLAAADGLAPMTLPDGKQTRTPLLPLTLDAKRPGMRLNPPKLGEHNEEILLSLGYSREQIQLMITAGVVPRETTP